MLNNDEVGAPVRSYAIVSAITNKVDVVKAIDSQKAINEAVHSYPQHNTTRNNPELTNYFSYELTDDDVSKLTRLDNDLAKIEFLNAQYPKHQSWQV